MPELGVHQSALLTDLALCVNRYRLFSPGWYVCVLAKVQLSPEESEVPGLVAMVNYGRRKQCEVRDEVFHEAPNFILDVFDSSDDADFVRRRERFCRAGVQEYLVPSTTNQSGCFGIAGRRGTIGCSNPMRTESSEAMHCQISGCR
jgi:hypothetical protein